VREPAAGIRLEAVAAGEQIIARAEIVEAVERHLDAARERLEIAVAPFEYRRVGGVASLAKRRCEHAVAGGIAAMQRLGHRAEICGHAAGE
jgi:precorrin-6B methylase 1